MERRLVSVVMIALACGNVQALLAGPVFVNPYTPDAATVVLYHLDEPIGATTAADASGHGLTLTRNTASPFTGVAGPDGLGSAAGPFPRSGALAELSRQPNAAELALFSTPRFTIEAWVRSPSLSASSDHDGIFYYRDVNNSQLQFAIRDGYSPSEIGSLHLGYRRDDNPSSYYSVQTAALSWDPNEWYHVAVTYDANTAAANDSIITFYRTAFSDTSGVPQMIQRFTDRVDMEPLTLGGILRVGGFDGSGIRQLGGYLDEVRFSNEVRTDFHLSVPEPATFVLLGLGGLMAFFRRRPRR